MQESWEKSIVPPSPAIPGILYLFPRCIWCLIMIIPKAATVAIGWTGRDPKIPATPTEAISAPPPITPKGVTRM